MILSFRPIKVWPAGWLDTWTAASTRRSPFSASYANTLELLKRELAQLGATDVTLQVDATERDCRLDGQLRASAKVGYPGVILSFRSAKHGTLSYPCNRFDRWQDNLRAIALGLEALRRVERYGIAERGQQYAGWAELPSGIPLARAMSVEEAARFIAEHAGSDWLSDVEDDPSFALALFRDAAKTLHPDAGGDAELFRKLTEARDLLRASFPDREAG